MSNFGLKGKTVVVTGCNRGIGRAIALEFIKNECRVVAICKKVKPDFITNNTEHIFVKSDVNDLETIEKWLVGFVEHNGNIIDVVVNNAGVLIKDALLDFKKIDWDHIMNTNLKSVFFISQI